MRALLDCGLPITRACTAADISRSSFHYQLRRTEDVELVERIKEIREKKPRWGYKRVQAKLRKEGFVVNHKRTERIWRDHGFTLSARRRRKKVRTGETVPQAACAPNHVWTYDFERHEALFYRVEVKGLHLRAVAATRAKLRAA